MGYYEVLLYACLEPITGKILILLIFPNLWLFTLMES